MFETDAHKDRENVCACVRDRGRIEVEKRVNEIEA